MNPRRNSGGRALLLLGLGLFLSSRAALGFTALYAFGDSLTDTGRVPSQAPNYFNKRFSNGPVWPEYLSPRLGFPFNSTNNDAYAGSRTGSGQFPQGLLDQVNGLTAPTDAASALFVAWSGGNDFLNNLSAGTNNGSWNNVVVSAVNNISNAVNVLYGKGARTVLVPNLPDIGKTPRMRNNYSSAFQDYVTGEVMQFNSSLGTAMGAIRQSKPGLQLLVVDVFGKMTFLATNLGTYGFTVVTTDALDDPSLTDKSFGGPGSNYVFWDSVHPTTKSHALIADWFFQTLASTQGVAITSTRTAGGLDLTMRNLETARGYTLQVSTNLPAWTEAFKFQATNESWTISRSLAEYPKAFYRVQY